MTGRGERPLFFFFFLIFMSTPIYSERKMDKYENAHSRSRIRICTFIFYRDVINICMNALGVPPAPVSAPLPPPPSPVRASVSTSYNNKYSSVKIYVTYIKHFPNTVYLSKCRGKCVFIILVLRAFDSTEKKKYVHCVCT